jgi:hypothetical protein
VSQVILTGDSVGGRALGLNSTEMKWEGYAMNLQIAGSVALAAILILPSQLRACGPRTGASFQESPGSYKVVSQDTYRRVLDIVFPRDDVNRDYDFVLRFEPSFAPESQIVVRRMAGRFEVTEYTSLSGNIYRQLNRVVAHGGKEEPGEMAKLIQVRKRLIEVSDNRVKQWRGSLANSIGASMKVLEQRAVEAERGVGTITLDGTFYRLWYDQVGSQISFYLLDHEISNREVTGNLELARWMNALRLNVQKLK